MWCKWFTRYKSNPIYIYIYIHLYFLTDIYCKFQKIGIDPKLVRNADFTHSFDICPRICCLILDRTVCPSERVAAIWQLADNWPWNGFSKSLRSAKTSQGSLAISLNFDQFRTNSVVLFLPYIYQIWYIGLDSERLWHYKCICELCFLYF